MSTVANPVLPGFTPDPSICRADDTYVLVTSSFAYWPAIPVYLSNDLVSWRLAGHVVVRPEQLDLAGLDLSDGVWAPTVRYHDGTFTVVVTVCRDRRGARTLLFTATNPAGPWGDAVELDVEGIDPSLFFDDDGRAWLTACRDAHDLSLGPAEITLQEYDPRAQRLVGPVSVIWRGSARQTWVEGPHLYRTEAGYHLICAEGGTERNHAVTAAHAPKVTGPYTSDRRNPLLTHRQLGEGHPVQNVGHADLVDTPAGETWAVVLGVRPVEGHHLLGRETFLVPVEWDPQGPVFAPGEGRVPDRIAVPVSSAPSSAESIRAVHDDFDEPELAACWVSLRRPLLDAAVTRADGERGLRLRAETALGATDAAPAYLGQRAQHQRFRASTRVLPGSVAAGIAAVQNDQRTVTALAHIDGTDALVHVVAQVDGETLALEPTRLPAPAGGLELALVVDDLRITVHARSTAEDARLVADLDARPLSTESAGGFVGLTLGPYAVPVTPGETGEALFEYWSYAPGLGHPFAASVTAAEVRQRSDA